MFHLPIPKALALGLALCMLAVLLTACGLPPVISLSMSPALTAIKGENLSLVVEPQFESELSQEAYQKAAAAIKLTYTSSDSTCVAVDDKGAITGLAAGTATITVKLNDSIQANCVVTVEIPLESVTAPDEMELQTNGITDAKMEVTLLPLDTTDTELVYTSDNEEVATVDKDGNITAVGKGSAVITAAAGNKVAKTTMNVTVNVTGIGLDSTAGWIYVGGFHQVQPYTLPVEADATTYTYSSDNAKVATVNGSGMITGKAVGTAKLTISGAGFTQTYTIEVRNKPAPKVTKPSNTGKSGNAAGTASGTGTAGGRINVGAGGGTDTTGGGGADVGTSGGDGGSAPPEVTPPYVNDSPTGGLDPDAGTDVGSTWE